MKEKEKEEKSLLIQFSTLVIHLGLFKYRMSLCLTSPGRMSLRIGILRSHSTYMSFNIIFQSVFKTKNIFNSFKNYHKNSLWR